MQHTVKFTDNISEADALLAMQTKLKKNARLQAAAKSCTTPIYVAKASTMTQLTKAILALMTDYEDGFENFAPEVNVLKKIDALEVVEFRKLVSSIRPDESEDVVLSACQKLTVFFHQRHEQTFVFVTQHGFLPLMELLEVPRTRVICAVLQVLNQIVKDNTDFLENACLVGLAYAL